MPSSLFLHVSPAKEKRNAKSIKKLPSSAGKAAPLSSVYITKRNEGAAKEERRGREKGAKRVRFLMHDKQWRKKTPKRMMRRKEEAGKIKKLEEALRAAQADVAVAQATLAGVEAEALAAARAAAGIPGEVIRATKIAQQAHAVSPLTIYSGCVAAAAELQFTEGCMMKNGGLIAGGEGCETICAKRSELGAALASCVTAEDRAAIWSVSALPSLMDGASISASSSGVRRPGSFLAKQISQSAHEQSDERNEVEQSCGEFLCEVREDIDEVKPVASSSASSGKSCREAKSVMDNSKAREAAPPKTSDVKSDGGSSNASKYATATALSKATKDSNESSSIATRSTTVATMSASSVETRSTSVNSSMDMKISSPSIRSITETNSSHVGNSKVLFDDEGNPCNNNFGYEGSHYEDRGHSFFGCVPAQLQAHITDEACRCSDRTNGFPDVKDEPYHTPAGSTSSPEITACHSLVGTEASPQMNDEACRSVAGSDAYTEGEGQEVVLFSVEMGHLPAHSKDDESIDESTMASTIKTRLTLISATDIPCVKELQPLGGPKYYVTTNTRTRQAKIIHEAMPVGYDPGVWDPNEEKGYEVLEYRLVENEGNKSTILGMEMLDNYLMSMTEEISDAGSSFSHHTPQIGSANLADCDGLSFSISVPSLPAEGDNSDCCESLASHRTSATRSTGYTKSKRPTEDAEALCEASRENCEDKRMTASYYSSGSGANGYTPTSDLAAGPEKIDTKGVSTATTTVGLSELSIATEWIGDIGVGTVDSYHTGKTEVTSLTEDSGKSRASSILSRGTQYAMERACCGGSFCGRGFYVVLS